VGIGPYTNLMLLDQQYPGILKQADLFLMGGYIRDMPPGYPQWRNSDDYNIQVDVQAAHYVLEQADPTIVPLAVSAQTALCRSDLPRLASGGRLGELLVRQAELFARTEQFAQKYGTTCAGVPADIINFHHDPLACALALGWREGVTIETLPLKFEIREGWLYETPDSGGMPRRVVTQIDGRAFNRYWCDVVGG
jgi:inosine-uridine nucleoside N-ribohydrolase